MWVNVFLRENGNLGSVSFVHEIFRFESEQDS
jgi:hypothetical protein